MNRFLRVVGKSIGLFFFLLSICEFSYSQDFIFKNKKNKLGFNVGYGGQNFGMALANINEDDARIIADFLDVDEDSGLGVDYFYEVFFFQLQYYHTLSRSRTMALDLLLQPQYNVTSYRLKNHAVERTDGYEYGLNIGLVARKNMLRDFLSIYIGASTGPHYVSGTPTRQADGFIFSSSFFGGINIRFMRNVYLDIRPGYRHISNANFKHPNSGINNLVINSGLFVAL